MTGFGVATAEDAGTHYTVEVRSLNNKYFKGTLRLPDELQALEAELEPALRRRLNRGSVVLTLQYSDVSEQAGAHINTAALASYLKQLNGLGSTLGDTAVRVDVGSLLALPGVVVQQPREDRLEAARSVVLRLADEACDRLLAMREREGRMLHDDLHRNRALIAERLAVVARRAPAVVEEYQARLRQRVESLLRDSGAAVRDEDLIREVAVYAERSDIAEEIARLTAHLDQFGEIIDATDPEPAGRTLDFLTQEMLREANTIASKSSDTEISRAIVEIKGAIDRIREQVQNVE
ncbi:MAG: YicC family protein [Phycisphaeraceae bacterium]|nr:MAG: YicC family protein [Phycisphaeraceae bacterium]